MSRKVLLGILAAAVIILVGGCILQESGLLHMGNDATAEEEVCKKQLFAMDTFMEFTAYGENAEKAVDAAMEEVKRLDELWSPGSSSGEVARLNETGSLTVSEDTASIIRTGLDLHEKTGGLFDFTIYPVMKLWGFPTKEYRVPDEEEIQETLKLVDASRVEIDEENLVKLGPGQQVDFGGIAKGYTSARVMECFREYGITSGMVSLGGNIQTLGKKTDGSPWNIGIRDPSGGQQDYGAVVSVEDRAVVTSGGYERYFEENGKRYIHIIDPRTGYPVEGDLVSVTVVSQDGTLADALSTSLYIMGLEGAKSWWQENGSDFEIILLDEAGEYHVSEGIRENFRSEAAVHVVERQG